MSVFLKTKKKLISSAVVAVAISIIITRIYYFLGDYDSITEMMQDSFIPWGLMLSIIIAIGFLIVAIQDKRKFDTIREAAGDELLAEDFVIDKNTIILDGITIPKKHIEEVVIYTSPNEQKRLSFNSLKKRFFLKNIKNSITVNDDFFDLAQADKYGDLDYIADIWYFDEQNGQLTSGRIYGDYELSVKLVKELEELEESYNNQKKYCPQCSNAYELDATMKTLSYSCKTCGYETVKNVEA